MAANWLPMTLKAFRHNQRILHSKVKGMSLLLDSVDFKLKGRTLSDAWSFKENGTAGRFMVATDFLTRVHGLWGQYSPKVYDGHWVKDHKDTLKRRFPDDKIGADCHFEWARDNMSNPSFFVPYPEPKKRRNSDEIPELPKKKKLYNEAIKKEPVEVAEVAGKVKERALSRMSLMSDPVATADCHVYKREVITEWLVGHTIIALSA
eukprot:m51a1_g11614 hypothetical protein (206) ;mRNA; f:1184-5915